MCKPVPIPCRECGRFLGYLDVGSSASFKCPNCGALPHYLIKDLRCAYNKSGHKRALSPSTYNSEE